MTKKKVWRYRCDFCKKGGLHAGHMRRHEKHCTNNPNRECRVCSAQKTNVQGALMVAVLVDGLVRGETDPQTGHEEYDRIKQESFLQICEMLGNCPACILSVLRQGKIVPEEHWDYKTAHDEYWKERNNEAAEAAFSLVEQY